MPDSVSSSSDAELRAHVERVLSSVYELDHELGRGGMGIVYLARDKRLKRQVAIKLLPPELAFRSEIRTRFLREAETAASLSHPSIVPIYSVDEREGLVFFVMGYVDGENLATRLHSRGALPPEEVRRILRETADALAYAHARGVVHRDIKPDNILLDRETSRAMVTDFGIARAVSDGGDSRLTATGVAIGTPAFMSPEQCAGEREVDGRSDLYSLGVVGYQLLTGDLPFNATSTPALLVKHLSERPTPILEKRADLPDDLARAVMVLLEKEPAHRFPSAQALCTALDTREAPAWSPPPMPTPGGRRPDAPLAPGPAQSAPSYADYPGRPSYDYAPRPVAGGLQQRYTYDSLEAAGPTALEQQRWFDRKVVAYRRLLPPYIAVNVVIVLMAIFSSTDLTWVTVFWSVYMAFKYAKLWSDGYDWRDVFKQPRDKLFFDAASEVVDDARALFDKDKRNEVRERTRRSRALGGGLFTPSDGTAPVAVLSPAALDAAGPHKETIRQAWNDRDEIVKLVDAMPRAEQSRVAEVVPSAKALADKVQSLALLLVDLDRNSAPNAGEVIEREIMVLESQANPLDRLASEDRIRRLALLKRQRRALADVIRQRADTAQKLETCRATLQSLRFDVLRLRTGGASAQGLTQLAERALDLARDVDGALAAGEAARAPSGGRLSDRRA